MVLKICYCAVYSRKNEALHLQKFSVNVTLSVVHCDMNMVKAYYKVKVVYGWTVSSVCRQEENYLQNEVIFKYRHKIKD